MNLKVRDDEIKKLELERAIADEEARLAATTGQLISAVRYDLDLLRWLREYPLEATVFAFSAGLAVSQLKARRFDGSVAR